MPQIRLQVPLKQSGVFGLTNEFFHGCYNYQHSYRFSALFELVAPSLSALILYSVV